MELKTCPFHLVYLQQPILLDNPIEGSIMEIV